MHQCEEQGCRILARQPCCFVVLGWPHGQMEVEEAEAKMPCPVQERRKEKVEVMTEAEGAKDDKRLGGLHVDAG